MAEYLVQDTTLTAIADAVRAKKGTTEPIALTDLAAEIESIQSGGGSSSNKLALVVGVQSADNPYDITASDLEGVTVLGDYAFYNKRGLRSIDLSNVTNMPTYAFYACTNLTSVSMPKVTSIDKYAFYVCTNLTSVSMPKVTSIKDNAFNGCYALTSLTIPSTCTMIGTRALQCGESSNKCTFIFEGTTPPAITSATIFANLTNKIIVPVGCGEAYKTATNWSALASYIEEATE